MLHYIAELIRLSFQLIDCITLVPVSLTTATPATIPVVPASCSNSTEEFVVTFLSNRNFAPDFLRIIVTSFQENVNVRVTSPMWFQPYTDNTTLVASNAAVTIDVDATLHQVNPGKSGRGVLISGDIGTTSLSVIVISKQQRSCDGYLALPVSTLGHHYYVITSASFFGSHMAILATSNNTQVRIQVPSSSSGIYYAGSEFTSGSSIIETLQAYETMLLLETDDLSGIEVYASQPVAVYAGNSLSPVHAALSSDNFAHLVEQFIPVHSYGTDFLIFPIPGRFVTAIKLLAPVSGTVVRIAATSTSGMTWQSVQPGDFIEYVTDGPEEAVSVLSSGPILVVQFVPSMTSHPEESPTPAMTLIPAVQHYRDSYYFSTPDDTGLTRYALVTAQVAVADWIQLDGIAVGPWGWEPMPGVEGWVGVALNLTNVTHHLSHPDPTVRFGVVLYGSSAATGCTYAFPAGFCLPEVSLPEVRLKQCCTTAYILQSFTPMCHSSQDNCRYANKTYTLYIRNDTNRLLRFTDILTEDPTQSGISCLRTHTETPNFIFLHVCDVGDFV